MKRIEVHGHTVEITKVGDHLCARFRGRQIRGIGDTEKDAVGKLKQLETVWLRGTDETIDEAA
jgi:hypothetical protein